jgi:formate dehydrogenase maturation protein FdhE
MATTKKNETKKASTKKQVTNNETRVVCPVCGSEFDVLAQFTIHLQYTSYP